MGASEILVLGAIAIAIANFGVSVAVLRSGYYSAGQAWSQIALTWLVPVFGVIVVGVFLWSHRQADDSRSAGWLGDVVNIDESHGPGGGHHAP